MEERNVKISLDKARDWYNKGGELKELALSAFSEKEITESALPNTWEEFKEEIKTSENIELPLKEGQIVTLLDGKKYQVVKNNINKFACYFCSLNKTKCGKDRCNITHINGKISCSFVIPPNHYFKLYED